MFVVQHIFFLLDIMEGKRVTKELSLVIVKVKVKQKWSFKVEAQKVLRVKNDIMKFPTFLYHHPGLPRHPPVPPPATRGRHYGGPRPRAEGDLVTSPSTARSGTRDSASQRLAPPPPWPPIASSPASASATCSTDCQHKV